MGKHGKKIISGDWNKEGLLSIEFRLMLSSHWRGRQDHNSFKFQFRVALRIDHSEGRAEEHPVGPIEDR
jgi:hypothetical protein